MNFAQITSHPAASSIPAEILEAAKKRASHFQYFYQQQGMEIDDFISDLFLAWAENPELEPGKIVGMLNSKIRRGAVQDKITKSKMAADIFFESHNPEDPEDEDVSSAMIYEEQENEDVQKMEEAENEAVEIMEFATSAFGLGLRRKTVGDYLRRDAAGFVKLARSGLDEYRKQGARWRGLSCHSGRGRPANFELCGMAKNDSFAPKKGSYYKSPDHYNALRRIRRAAQKSVKTRQMELVL